MKPYWSSLRAPLRRSAFGLVLGAVSVVAIVWSNVVVPDHESDDEYALWYLAFYVGLLFYFFAAGLHAGSGKTPVSTGVLAGLASAVTFAAIVMATFIVIDNLFLDIVMQQPDKLSGFRLTGLQSTRDYVNQGNFMGLFTVLPVSAAPGRSAGPIEERSNGTRDEVRPATALNLVSLHSIGVAC